MLANGKDIGDLKGGPAFTFISYDDYRKGFKYEYSRYRTEEL